VAADAREVSGGVEEKCRPSAFGGRQSVRSRRRIGCPPATDEVSGRAVVLSEPEDPAAARWFNGLVAAMTFAELL
jgi:hypothetical protein